MNGVTFVDRLRTLLQSKNISQNQFLKDNGLAKGSMGNWEQRGNIPSADIVLKIAKYLNVSMEFLLTGEEGKIDDFDVLETFSESRLKNISFSHLTTEEAVKLEEDTLLNNYRFLNESNKKVVQAMIHFLLLNQE